jgi:hypothetical protein
MIALGCSQWRNRAEIALVTAVAGFWAWFFLLSVVSIDTAGWWGVVTEVLWFSYILGVPVLGFIVLGTAIYTVIRQNGTVARFTADLTVLVVTVGVWYWSLTS